MTPKLIPPKYLTREVAQRAVQTALYAVMDENSPLRPDVDGNNCHVVVIVPAMMTPQFSLFSSQVVVEYETEKARLNEALWQAVAAQDFEASVRLRDQRDQLKKPAEELTASQTGHHLQLNHILQPFVLYEQSVGDRATWKYPFDDIARCKALQLWTDRIDDGPEVVPHLLFPNDTVYCGGVKREGILTCISGVQAYFDKLMSGIAVDTMIRLSRHAYENDKTRAGLDFIPPPAP